MERIHSSDEITKRYMDSLLLEVRHIGSVLADTSFPLWGHTFSTPVMTGALSHLHRVHEGGMAEMARGAARANAVMFSGMGGDDEVKAICDTGAKLVKIIKTYKDRDLILHRIQNAESCGAISVGMDIDHAFERRNGYDSVDGMEMRPITEEELAAFVRSTKLPFTIKGVLSVQDALLCKKAGVKAIVVSHHNGRLDYSVPPLMVLPEIRRAVGNEMKVFVDCGLESGTDIFKCLALGADACSVGRPLMESLRAGGAEKVAEHIRALTDDLRYTLSMTGSADIFSIDPSVVRKMNGEAF